MASSDLWTGTATTMKFKALIVKIRTFVTDYLSSIRGIYLAELPKKSRDVLLARSITFMSDMASLVERLIRNLPQCIGATSRFNLI